MPEDNPLSAAEALVLLSLPRFDGRQAVKIGLMSLQAQGILRTTQVVKTNVFGSARFPALRVASEIRYHCRPQRPRSWRSSGRPKPRRALSAQSSRKGGWPMAMLS